MKKKLVLSLLSLIIALIFLGFPLANAAFAQTATPRPTFGPTCSPSPAPPLAPTATPTPTLPVTAGAAPLTVLTFFGGTLLLLGSFAGYFLLRDARSSP